MKEILSQIKFFQVHPKNLKNIGLRKKQTQAKKLRKQQPSKKEMQGIFDVDKNKNLIV